MPPIVTIASAEKLLHILEGFLQRSEAGFAMIIDRGGTVLSQAGRPPEGTDITILGALAAGSFAATGELASRVGEGEFNALYQQGANFNILMNAIDENTMLVTLFGNNTSVGLVRFYATKVTQDIHTIILELSNPQNAGPIFTEQDLNNAANIFENPPPEEK